MEDQEMQAQFIQWLAQKTGAKTEDELKQIIMKLQSDKGQMQQVMQEFQAEMSGGQPTMQRAGGKLAYLQCLSQFKKGGKVGCGCGAKLPDKQISKAQLGAIIGGIGKAAKAVKTAMPMINKVAGGIQKAGQLYSAGKQMIGAAKQNPQVTMTNSLGATGQVSMPNINTPTMPSFTVGMVNSPNNIPGGQVLYPGVTNSVQDTTPKLVEKGAKLKVKKLKK